MFVLILIPPKAVASYEPTNGFAMLVPEAAPSSIEAVKTLVTRPAKTDEHKFARTLKIKQIKQTINSLGNFLNNLETNLFIVPFLARPLSLILIGGIIYHLLGYFVCSRFLDKYGYSLVTHHVYRLR